MSIATHREFRVGEVVGRAISILFRNAAAFAVISLSVTLPILLFDLFVALRPQVVATSQEQTIYSITSSRDIFSWLLQFTLTGVATGAVTFGTVQDLRGAPASFVECVRRGLKLMLPVLGVSLVTTILVALGSVLFLIPGIILGIMLWVAVPVTVIERPGVFASLSRSAVLTKGYRWRIFGAYLLITLLVAILFGVIAVVVAPLVGVSATILVEWLGSAASSAVGAVLSAVGYFRFRSIKEGVDIEDVAKVFD